MGRAIPRLSRSRLVALLVALACAACAAPVDPNLERQRTALKDVDLDRGRLVLVRTVFWNEIDRRRDVYLAALMREGRGKDEAKAIVLGVLERLEAVGADRLPPAEREIADAVLAYEKTLVEKHGMTPAAARADARKEYADYFTP